MSRRHAKLPQDARSSTSATSTSSTKSSALGLSIDPEVSAAHVAWSTGTHQHSSRVNSKLRSRKLLSKEKASKEEVRDHQSPSRQQAGFSTNDNELSKQCFETKVVKAKTKLLPSTFKSKTIQRNRNQVSEIACDSVNSAVKSHLLQQNSYNAQSDADKNAFKEHISTTTRAVEENVSSIAISPNAHDSDIHLNSKTLGAKHMALQLEERHDTVGDRNPSPDDLDPGWDESLLNLSQDVDYEGEVRWDSRSQETIQKIMKSRGQYSAEGVREIVAKFSDPPAPEPSYQPIGQRLTRASFSPRGPTQHSGVLASRRTRASKKTVERLQSRSDVDDMINLLRGIIQKKQAAEEEEKSVSVQVGETSEEKSSSHSAAPSCLGQSDPAAQEDDCWSDDDLFQDNSLLLELTQNPDKFCQAGKPPCGITTDTVPVVPGCDSDKVAVTAGRSGTTSLSASVASFSSTTNSLGANSSTRPCSSLANPSTKTNSSTRTNFSSARSLIKTNSSLASYSTKTISSTANSFIRTNSPLTNSCTRAPSSRPTSNSLVTNLNDSSVIPSSYVERHGHGHQFTTKNSSTLTGMNSKMPVNRLQFPSNKSNIQGSAPIQSSSFGKKNSTSLNSKKERTSPRHSNAVTNGAKGNGYNNKFSSSVNNFLNSQSAPRGTSPQSAGCKGSGPGQCGLQRVAVLNPPARPSVLSGHVSKTESDCSSRTSLSFEHARGGQKLGSVQTQRSTVFHKPISGSETSNQCTDSTCQSSNKSHQCSNTSGQGATDKDTDFFDLSLPDEILLQLTEPDEILDSQEDVLAPSFRAQPTNQSKSIYLQTNGAQKKTGGEKLLREQQKPLWTSALDAGKEEVFISPVKPLRQELQAAGTVGAASPMRAFFKRTLGVQGSPLAMRVGKHSSPCGPSSSTPVKLAKGTEATHAGRKETNQTAHSASESAEDALFDDSFMNDQALFESQILPMLEKAESEALAASQVQKPQGTEVASVSASPPVTCSPQEIEQKRQAALYRRSQRLSQRNARVSR